MLKTTSSIFRLRRLRASLLLAAGSVCATAAVGAEAPEADAAEKTANAMSTNAESIGATPQDIARNQDAAWKIYKSKWDAADEAAYARFVRAIGWSNCTSLESCLEDEANPYRDTDKRSFAGDCADMAYTLRAYFAWKNGLPFSYQSAMRTADGKSEDLRYSTGGNVVAGRRSVASASPVSAPSFIARIPGEVSTAMFRTHPETGGGRSHDDFYPIEISREAVRPGVIAYDIYGHVGIVYDILDDGRVLIIASHPDHSVSRSVYGPNFIRSKPALGSGLKAWRPIELVGAEAASDGSLRGGRIRAASNDELPDFSVEQYVGNVPHPEGDWSLGEFRVGDRSMPFHDFVRKRLAAPGFKFNPVVELRNGLETICGAVRDRKYAVEAARLSRVHLRPHPDRLPINIYGTYGDWEAYSTPSRDARLKVSVIELRREVERHIRDVESGQGDAAYDGDDLAGDLWRTLNEEIAQCSFTYWRSDNSRIRLNLAHVFDRLWGLSFDPYHCPERRWGADGAELMTCSDDEEKTAWYNAQRFLRYQAERTYDVRMNFALDELKPPALAAPENGGLGVDAPADADIVGYVASLREDAPSTPSTTVAFAPGSGVLLAAGEPVDDEPRFPEWHYKIQNGLNRR
ncbi:MAG: hypothetical protein GC152_03875 [Alphaproteobacteria bacterium]|nr:hypothetical protein [Alphaproteobacteria bacterium]